MASYLQDPRYGSCLLRKNPRFHSRNCLNSCAGNRSQYGEQTNIITILTDATKLSLDEKISLNVSRLLLNPACANSRVFPAHRDFPGNRK